MSESDPPIPVTVLSRPPLVPVAEFQKNRVSLPGSQFSLKALNLRRGVVGCKGMCVLLASMLLFLRGCLQTRAALHAENLALRHQLLVLQRVHQNRRLRLRSCDRLVWVWLSRVWSNWRSTLCIVKPETVIVWHRQGFRLYWKWKSRVRHGRPSLPTEVQNLIQHMSSANPRWGAPRIHGELQKLGIHLAQATVAKYMVRQRKPPSQTWRTFLKNHAKELVSTDFFVVPTATFRLLFVFLVLSHDRRRLLHFGVTSHPTAECSRQSDAVLASSFLCISQKFAVIVRSLFLQCFSPAWHFGIDVAGVRGKLL